MKELDVEGSEGRVAVLSTHWFNLYSLPCESGGKGTERNNRTKSKDEDVQTKTNGDTLDSQSSIELFAVLCQCDKCHTEPKML